MSSRLRRLIKSSKSSFWPRILESALLGLHAPRTSRCAGVFRFDFANLLFLPIERRLLDALLRRAFLGVLPLSGRGTKVEGSHGCRGCGILRLLE